MKKHLIFVGFYVLTLSYHRNFERFLELVVRNAPKSQVRNSEEL